MRTKPFLCGLSFLAAVSLSAANWPEWRGPTQDGVTPETNLPTEWSATENVKWKTPLPDRGNSTPIVWEDKIFVTQAIEEGGKRLLLCFNRADGKLLWQSGTVHKASEQSHDTNPQASPSPVTDGERVVAWFGSAGVFCYDLEGKELWKRDLGKQSHEWGYASSPVIHKDWVFLNFGPGENSFLIALDKKTGKTVWQVDVEEKHYKDRSDGFRNQNSGVTGSWSTPIVINFEGREELIVSVPDKVQALDPKTGKVLWFARGLNPLIYTSTVYSDGIVFANGGFHGPDMAVKVGGDGDVTDTHKLWEGGRTQNRLGSAVVKDGRAYLITMPGIVECIDLKTGKTVWEERVRGNGPKNDSWSSFVLSGDRLYILNQSGDTIILKAGPELEVIAKNSIGNELTNASLAVSDGELFIRTHKNLWCIGAPLKTAGK